MMKPPLSVFRKSARSTMALGAALLTFGGCGDDVTVPRDRTTSEAAPSGGAAAEAKLDFASTSKGRSMIASSAPSLSNAAVPPPSADQAANANPAALVAPTMVIRNGAASIEVDSLELAIKALQSLATSMGGYVGNTTLTAGAYEVRSAVIELKLPAARYEAAVGSLAPIGKLESQTSTAEDVGEEFVDVTARQNNAHKLEERLITLLATRTGKLEDVLAVERELARVREEIERYEGRLRYLKSHVAISTLNVTVHEKAPVVAQYTGKNVIVESFRNAWTNFVQFIAVLISSLGWIIPVGVLVAIAVLVIKGYRKNRSK
ncbi:MAG: DUF4349 domain-containing protein [Gemmatimonadaceae bacterium]